MTGGSHANPYRVLARRGETELVIEGYDAINVNLRDIEKPGHLDHGNGRKISKGFLNLLENGYEVLPFAPQAAEYLSRLFFNLLLFSHPDVS
jgi:hypothetical protein